MADILVIEDDRDFARAIAKMLESEGHDVEISLDIEGGIEKLQELHPDLLILDVMFPEDAAAGFEAAREIRSMGQGFEKMPILMLSAINQRFPLGFGQEDRDEQWLPVSNFLEKPVNFDQLKTTVEHILNEATASTETTAS